MLKISEEGLEQKQTKMAKGRDRRKPLTTESTDYMDGKGRRDRISNYGRRERTRNNGGRGFLARRTQRARRQPQQRSETILNFEMRKVDWRRSKGGN